MVGPARFERATFTQEQREAEPYGFLDDSSKASSYPEGSANPFSFASGARRHTGLDYDPAIHFSNNYPLNPY